MQPILICRHYFYSLRFPRRSFVPGQIWFPPRSFVSGPIWLTFFCTRVWFGFVFFTCVTLFPLSLLPRSYLVLIFLSLPFVLIFCLCFFFLCCYTLSFDSKFFAFGLWPEFFYLNARLVFSSIYKRKKQIINLRTTNPLWRNKDVHH